MANRIATVVEYKQNFFCFNDLKNFTNFKTEKIQGQYEVFHDYR